VGHIWYGTLWYLFCLLVYLHRNILDSRYLYVVRHLRNQHVYYFWPSVEKSITHKKSMKLTSETKLFLGIFAITGIILTIAILIMTKPEKPIAREVLTANAIHTLGPKDAKVWLVEFSDFQCPACGQFYPAVKQLTEKYKDSLFFVYRNEPLPIHAMALPAARAAEAAGLQGKYWEMHDALFTGQAQLSDAFIASKAAELGLTMQTFTTDTQSSAVQKIIDTDVSLGDSIGINATPTFYLNGIKLQLNTVNDLVTAVETELTNINK